MEELGTFINLFRRFTEWEWYRDVPVKTVFLHCLIRANYKPQKYKGRIIDRGSFVTSRKNMALETGLTEQQVRTALAKLTDTNDITKKTTNKETIINVVNYDKYQPNRIKNDEVSNQQNNHQITNKQPSNNQRITTINKDNKYNKDNNIFINIKNEPISPFPELEKELEKYEQEQEKIYESSLIELYESEFKRPLSQREVQIICQWSEEYEDKLIRYALREALTYDKVNINYIDRILLEWSKKGFTADDYEEGKR